MKALGFSRSYHTNDSIEPCLQLRSDSCCVSVCLLCVMLCVCALKRTLHQAATLDLRPRRGRRRRVLSVDTRPSVLSALCAVSILGITFLTFMILSTGSETQSPAGHITDAGFTVSLDVEGLRESRVATVVTVAESTARAQQRMQRCVRIGGACTDHDDLT